MNNNLINREAVIDRYYAEWKKQDICDGSEDRNWLMQCIDEAPAVDAVEVKHGRWILGIVEPGYCTPGGNRPWVCSECGKVKSWRLDKPTENYCSNCGAKMDGE